MTRVDADPHAAALALAREIASAPPTRCGRRSASTQAWNAPAGGLKLETELQVGLIGAPNQLAAVTAGMTKQPAEFADPEVSLSRSGRPPAPGAPSSAPPASRGRSAPARRASPAGRRPRRRGVRARARRAPTRAAGAGLLALLALAAQLAEPELLRRGLLAVHAGDVPARADRSPGGVPGADGEQPLA